MRLINIALKKNSFLFVMITAVIVFLFVFILCISLGLFKVPFLTTIKILVSKIVPIRQDWTKAEENVILLVRLPRVCASVLVGVALTISSCAYQSLFNNPLVSSDLLGVSSGASVGAVISILLGLDNLLIMLFSFSFGIVTVFITVVIPCIFKNKSNLVLVLSGIITGGFMSSFLSLLKLLADPETDLPEITYWLMGSVAKASATQLKIAAPIIICSSVSLILLSWRLNLLSLGDESARSIGVNVHLEKMITIILSTLLTSIAVSFSGNIAWIGLIIPHFARFFVGGDNRRLIPLCAVFGATFLMLCDLLARTISNIDIPLGILTGIIGAPVFAIILLKKVKNV